MPLRPLRRPPGATGVAVLVTCLVGALSAPAAAADPQAGTKVVGGRDAAAAWPATTALLRADRVDPVDAQFCGGTLVAPQWVLTAAHCVVGEGDTPRDPATLDVVVGVRDLRTVTAQDRVRARTVRPHEGYRILGGYDHDLALVELSRPVDAPPQPVAVPGLEPLQDGGTTALVLGWGRHSPDGQPEARSPVLQEAEVPVLADETCDDPHRLGARMQPATMLCAGAGTTTDAAADACTGDSGGPLLARDPRGLWRQVGLVSFGPTCGHTPTGYTELIAHARWLEQTAGLDLGTFADTGASPHEAAIERAALLGVVSGFPDGHYRPTVAVTREQVATLLVRALGVTPTALDAEGGFPDVDATHRAAVNALARLDVVAGYADGSYRPDVPVRRGQLAAMLSRALDLPPGDPTVFSDVRGTTHEQAIGALVAAGVTEGYRDGTFRPELLVPRDQVAALLVRALLSDGRVGTDAPTTS